MVDSAALTVGTLRYPVYSSLISRIRTAQQSVGMQLYRLQGMSSSFEQDSWTRLTQIPIARQTSPPSTPPPHSGPMASPSFS